ncbi:MAG: hypothetical protein NT070_00170 [Cyanobacteria bacterium]|nr:hypothetical protein [Cyanobacteriota bacterium]
MKKVIALSLLSGAATATLLAALPSPSYSQNTVLPIIIGGNLGINPGNPGNLSTFIDLTSFTNTTILTPLGLVNMSTLNGTANFNDNTTNSRSLVVNVVSSNLFYASGHGPGNNVGGHLHSGDEYQVVFTGTSNGSVQFGSNGSFTNTPTTINATIPNTQAYALPASINIVITGGSIELPTVLLTAPAPVGTDSLNVISDLRISNSTLLSPDSQQPIRSSGISGNNFSTSSFDGGRILTLENK